MAARSAAVGGHHRLRDHVGLPASELCTAEGAIARSRGSRLLPVSAERELVHPLLVSVQYVGTTGNPAAAAVARVDAAGRSGWADDRCPFPGARRGAASRRRSERGCDDDGRRETAPLRGPSGSSYSLERGYEASVPQRALRPPGSAVERVKAYIDGFNLYHGLREKYGRRYHWLDLEALVTKLLRPSQTLYEIDYFTARVRQQPTSEQRQATYLNALTVTCGAVRVVEGRFQQKTRECRQCHRSWVDHEEKETDVSIAVTLLEDGVNDVFDVALLISADSDLCPAVRALGRLYPKKRVVAAFPPARNSGDLRQAVNGAAFTIGHAKIRNSLLPSTVTTPTGLILTRPAYWH